MTPQDQDQLLHELLSGDEISAFRHASLKKGLDAIRTQRKRRRVTRAVAAGCLALLFPTGLLLIELSSRRQPEAAALQAGTLVQVNDKLKMQFISDEELFKLFPGRSIALIGKPGEQELIFLDKPSEAVQ